MQSNYAKHPSNQKYKIHYHNISNTHTLVLGSVMSHLDFCNSVLFGLPQKSIKKLQRLQNIAAKLVLNRTKYESSTESTKLLHWLPAATRIEFNIIVLVFKCLQENAPEYLQNLLTQELREEQKFQLSQMILMYLKQAGTLLLQDYSV